MNLLRIVTTFTATALLAAMAAASPAGAASSVTYVDGGSLWLSTLDGSQKVKIADPVTRSDETGSWQEDWLDVAQSDGGRIVAVRNKPGRISSYSWFQIWEPDGTSTVQGPLNAPSGWSTYAYPLGFDITADGGHLVYGYSNASPCCPISFAQGTYVRPASTSVSAPIDISGKEDPTLFGSRIVAHAGSTISVQTSAPGNPYPDTFAPWLDSSGSGLTQDRTDVAASGTLVALELQDTSVTPEIGRIAMLSAAGLDAPPPSPAPVDCFLPASGVAREASLSQDATRIAWTDADGLKVAGTPTTSADPCVLSAPPVLISATGRHASIGGADVAAFVAKPVTGADPDLLAPIAPAAARVKVAIADAKFAAVRRTSALPVTFPISEANVRATLSLRLSAKQARVFGLKPPGRTTSLKVGGGTTTSTKAGQVVRVKLRLTRTFRTAFARTTRAKPTLRKVRGTLTITLTRNGLSSTMSKTVQLTR